MASPPQDSHQTLLKGLRERERKALMQLYRENFPAIKKHVLSHGGSLEDAEDVFQDAMVVLYRKIESPDFTLSSSVPTFLFAIAKRTWLHKLSRRGKQQFTQLEQAPSLKADDLTSQIEKTERHRLFREKLGALGEDCQRVLRLFFAGESMIEIAKKMGYASEGYAKKRKYTCKQKLASLIKADRRFQEMQQ